MEKAKFLVVLIALIVILLLALPTDAGPMRPIQVTLPPNAMIVDDQTSDFVRNGPPFWQEVTGPTAQYYNGHAYYTLNNNVVLQDWGVWTFRNTGSWYEVFVYVPYNYATTRSAKYQLSTIGGTTTITVNQYAAVADWVSLGVHRFNQGDNTVRLDDTTGEPAGSYWVAFDAVAFVPVYKVFLPLITKPVPEIDAPPCRWPHTAGSFTGIAYKWGANLPVPGTAWRNAFEASVVDWSQAPTKLYFSYSTNGTVVLDTYYAQDNQGGYAQPYCNGESTTAFGVFGNLYYDIAYGYGDNHRRAVAGHEVGHSQSIGHIDDPNTIALMGYNPDVNTYFQPQPIDSALVNQVYP